MRKHLIREDENGAGLFGEVSVVGKPGTASQFQRRELVAVPALRRTHRSAFSRGVQVPRDREAEARGLLEELAQAEGESV